jgi:shikimate kinase
VKRGIVLVGAPGTGKTSIGLALARLGYWFEDREAALLARYGSIEEFRRRKDEAIARLHADFLAAVRAEAKHWVYESTALTERDFVTRLRDEFGGFAVRLEIPLDTALERVGARTPGANLSNDAEATGRHWQLCNDAYETMSFELSVDTSRHTPAELAGTIDAAFTAWRALGERPSQRVL